MKTEPLDPYLGAVIALDLAGLSGVGEGVFGEKPVLTSRQFAKENADPMETVGKGIKFIAERLVAERYIRGQFYGRGEALANHMVRVAIEMPIVSSFGNTNADTGLILKGLWLAMGGFADTRGAMVRSYSVTTVRKPFIGFGTLEKGAAPKDYAKREAMRVCRALGWDPDGLDAADAGALFYYAGLQWNPAAMPSTKEFWKPKPVKLAA